MNSSKYDLTSPQRNIWLMENFNENTPINVITGLVNIKNGFNTSLCDGAINNVIKNNDAMRARVIKEESETFQTILDYEYEKIEIVDMTSYSEKEIAEYIDSHALQSLNLYNEKLYDFKILKYNENQGSIFMRIHHIIADAWSCSKIGTQLIQYMENTDGSNNEEIEKNKPSYIEYINSEKEYENSEKYTKDSEFWKEYLSGIEEVISLKDHTNIVSTNASRYSVKLDKEINEKILNYCKENKISPYVLFLTALSTYVYRIKDKNDFVIGTPILNRSTFKEKQMLGMFVSTMPVRIKISENEKFIDLAKKIALDNMTLFRHQKYPYSKTLEYVHANSNIKTNLYNIIISYQNARTNIFDNNKYSTSWPFSKAIEDELQIHIMDMDDTGILTINYDYLNELFDSIEIEYLHTRIMALIDNAIQNIDVNIEDIRIMSIDEENKILYEFNNTYREYPKYKTVIELFEEQVEKTPDNIALVFEDKSMTYKELNEKANQLAHYLVEEKGIKPNDIVALILKRSFDMIIAILGVLKSGAAYLPIDPDFPTERIEYMLENSNSTINLDNNKMNMINYNAFSKNNILNENYSDSNLAYILYTSGSTGKPKGVMIEQGALKNLIYYFFNSDIYNDVNNIVSITTISFDIFVFDSIVSLVNGLKLVISNEEQQRVPSKLNKLIEKYDIDLMQTTPTRLKLMLDNIAEIPNIKNIKKIVLSGEKISEKLKESLVSLNKNVQIFNGYGPTENTVFSSFTNCTYENKISIGIPVENTQFYILDKKYRILPLNVSGELYVSGKNLARGYINNNELNEKSFIKWNDKIIYKTGDICIVGFDNKTYCLGRNDNQIKINGIRIELDEVSNVLNSYNGFDCVVIYKEINNKKMLIAYYVTNENLDINNLKKYISNFLPQFMRPNKYIKINKFPTTPNGKIDKRKLESYNDVDLPTAIDNIKLTQMQEKIKDIVCDILNIKNIGIEENIYEYGMDSLNLINLLVKLANSFEIDLSIKDLSKCMSIIDIEEIINISKKVKDNIPLKQDYYPLSSAQFGIFTNYSLNPDNIMYNIPFEMKFSNNINIEKLINAVKQVVNSTDTFFTKIEMINGELFQKIDKSRKYDVPVYYILEKDYKKRKKDCLKSFDLLDDLLFNINIFKTENNVYMVVNIHHIIFDGLSMNIFLDKLKKAYNEENLEKEKNSFGQFALYEKELKTSEKYNKAKKYFTDMFAEELPDNNMILDNKRKKERTFVGNKLTFKIDKKTSNLIYNFVNDNKVTLNSVFLSMFNLLLSKYMYSNDIIVGMATSGRNIQEEIDQIGMFVKTIPFRTKLNVDDNVLSYIKDTQTRVLDSIDNDIYSYESLVKDLNITRDPSRNPLFDVMFVYQNTGMPDIRFENEKVELSGISTNTSKFDITLEVMPNNDVFDINIEYASDLFSKETINRFANHYINAINSMLDNKSGKLSDIDIITKEEKDTILMEYNDTKTNYPSDKTVIDLFKEQVKLVPQNIAVVFEENEINYSKLDELSSKLAYNLLQNGVTKGDMVAIVMDKSLELIVSILAILKVGAAYVPIEIDFPKARIEYILDDTKAKVVLVNGNVLDVTGKFNVIDVNLSSNIYKISINNEDLKNNYTANDIAYVMYTSGTTGNPKGVMVTNRNIVRLIKNTNYIEFNKNDRIIQTGATSFDATTFEYYSALFNGLPVYLLKKQNLLDMKGFEEYILKNKITVMFVTTQLLNQIAEYKPELLDKFRIILTGGEAHSVKHIRLIKKYCNNLKLYNVYGPTENTTFSTYCFINKDFTSLPIGKPISNTTCYIVDKFGKLCYTNMPGELLVGGDGVALGYLNNSKLTAEKFVKDTFKNSQTNKMYKTGDLVYWNEEGNIEFCGRIDTQVKIRGFRIEPDEINQKLLEYSDIKESVVVVETHKNKKVIVAYYTSDVSIEKAKLVNYLKEFLPQYMIPTYFININKIPLNNSGKADKNKLFEIGQEIILDKENKANTETRYEGAYLKVYDLFSEVLGMQNISYDDDFFEIGGDSLLALKLVTNAIAKDIPITYPDLFKHPTIKELGDMLNKTLKEKSICEPMYSFDYTNANKVLSNNVYSNDMKINERLGNVFLTGVTGFLGAHILDEFMKNEKGKIYCLVRSKNGKEARVRLKEILNFFFGNKYDNEIGNRIFVIEDNVARLEKIELKDEYIKDIDVVINSAACVKHFGDYDLFEKINVNLVKYLIDFCVKNNKRFVQISTLSVSGNLLEAGQLDQTKVKPNTIFNENKLYIEQNLDNVYAYTKYLAEKLVYDAIVERNLKGKIMRMGNLTGRTNDGKFQPNVSENAFANRLKTMLSLNVLPKNMLDFYLEFTPINYAAKAVILLSKTDDKYNTFHLFNHNHAMLDFVDKVLNDELNIHLKHITKEEMTNLIETYSKQKDGFEKIKGIVLDVNKNKELEYVSNITVKSEFTIKTLEKLGFKWPVIDKEYITKYLNYLFDIGFLTKEEE